jgi:hypothetical protein
MATDTGAALIRCAVEALARQGIGGVTTDTPVSVYFGRSVFLQFFPSGHVPVGVRIEDRDEGALQREHRVLAEMSTLYGVIIPRPLALDGIGKSQMLIVESVPHQRTSLAEMCSLSPMVTRSLVDFLTGEGREPLPPESRISEQEFADCVAMLPEGLRGVIADRSVAKGWDDWLQRQPAVPQHCDFAKNNIGRTKDGFVIFDWEDYGAVNLAGFDVAVLLSSGCDFDAAQLALLLDGSHGAKTGAGFITEIMSGLLPENFDWRDFILINLTLFHALKKRLGYSEQAVDVTLTLARGLVQQPERAAGE